MDPARPGAHGDFLTRTTLRLGRGPVALSIAQVVRALQRVPGVLTVEADAVDAQALVAHDAAVTLTSLFAAVNSAGGAATVVADSRGGAAATARPLLHGKRRHIKSVAVLVMLAVIVIDITFPNNPEKRWLFIAPVVLLWTFMIIEGLVARRPSD